MQGIGVVIFSLGGKCLKRCLRGLTDYLPNTVLVLDNKATVNTDHKLRKIIKVGQTKYPSACYNMGIRELLKDDSIEHIFIVTDKCELIDDSVIQDYINAAGQLNLQGLYYCTDEEDPKGENKNIRLKIDIKDNTLNLNYGVGGNFAYLHKDVFKKVGFFDERYKGTMEWADFAYRISQKNLSTPFLWFPSLESAREKIIINDNDTNYTENAEDRLIRGMKVFYLKFKCEIKDLINIYTSKDIVQKLKKKVEKL